VQCILRFQTIYSSHQLEALGHCIPPPIARLTRAAIWRISMSSRLMSVNNHFPYLPIATNPKKNNPCIQTVIRIATKIESFLHWPIANRHWKFHVNPFGSFCAKLLTIRQTTTIKNLHNLSFLAEYPVRFHRGYAQLKTDVVKNETYISKCITDLYFCINNNSVREHRR